MDEDTQRERDRKSAEEVRAANRLRNERVEQAEIAHRTTQMVAVGIVSIIAFAGFWAYRGRIADESSLEVKPYRSSDTVRPERQTRTGSDAVQPQLRDFIKQTAREYGASEEEVRQTIKNAMMRGARSAEDRAEIERLYGR